MLTLEFLLFSNRFLNFKLLEYGGCSKVQGMHVEKFYDEKCFINNVLRKYFSKLNINMLQLLALNNNNTSRKIF